MLVYLGRPKNLSKCIEVNLEFKNISISFSNKNLNKHFHALKLEF